MEIIIQMQMYKEVKLLNKRSILICKNDSQIIISNDGKRLIIDKNNPLFDKLLNKNKDEIKEWFNSR